MQKTNNTKLSQHDTAMGVDFPQQEISAESLSIFLAFRRITHAVDSYSHNLARKHQITSPQMICLFCLSQYGPMTVTQLGKYVSLSGGTLIGIIDRLEAKGLAFRKRDTHDRRKVVVTVTPRGRQLTPMLLENSVLQAIQKLAPAQRASLAESLEHISEIMKRASA